MRRKENFPEVEEGYKHLSAFSAFSALPALPVILFVVCWQITLSAITRGFSRGTRFFLTPNNCPSLGSRHFGGQKCPFPIKKNLEIVAYVFCRLKKHNLLHD
jgi:hypothetical protein